MIRFSITKIIGGSHAWEHLRIRVGCFLIYRRRRGFRTSHPLRKRLESLSERGAQRAEPVAWARLYASEGRPWIAPEQLLSALLLQVFYGIRIGTTAHGTIEL